MNIDALRWKYGLPGCTITASGDTIVTWSGCSISSPTAEQIATAEDDYAAYLTAMALGDYPLEEPQSWRNDDMDTGTEILVEWTAPSLTASWRIEGQIWKAGNAINFGADLICVCTTDAYGTVTRTVSLACQHTAPPTGASVADVTWVNGSDVLYSDYDATSGKVRLRVTLASDGWRAQGTWKRLNRLAEYEALA